MAEPARRVERRYGPSKKLRIKKNQPSLKAKEKYYKKRDKKLKANLVVIFLSYLIVAFLYLGFSRIGLAHKKRELSDLEGQVRIKEITRDTKKEELEKAIDINEIKRYAIENLHMQVVSESNTRDINVDR